MKEKKLLKIHIIYKNKNKKKSWKTIYLLIS